MKNLDYKWYKYFEIPGKHRIFPIVVVDKYGWPCLTVSINL